MRRSQNGKRFALLIKRYGYTPGRLAEELQVSRGIISHWSCGKRKPSLEHVKDIARLLGCSEDEVHNSI